MTINERIRNRRIELDITQDELAKRTGYKGRSNINKIETGAASVPLKKIDAFAKALNVSYYYLMGYDEEPTHATHISIDENANFSFDTTLSEEEYNLIIAIRKSKKPDTLKHLYQYVKACETISDFEKITDQK